MFTFIETKLFKLQELLIESPNEGSVIPRTGGVRKLRWRAAGRGKRGGHRVIYFVKPEQHIIWLLTIYPKNVADNIPANVLRKIRQEVENG